MVKAFRPPKKTHHKKGKTSHQALRLEIDSLDHEGLGVAKQHSPIVFVSGALPGETCLVDITEQKKQVFKGRVKQVLQASRHRKEAICPHFNQCGGCQTQYVDHQTMLGFKQEAITQLLNKLGAVDIEQDVPWQSPILDSDVAYRRKARLAVDFRQEQSPRIGYRGKGTAEVINITSCPVLKPDLAALIAPIRTLCFELNNKRAIGHIELLQGDRQEGSEYVDTRPLVVFRMTKDLSQQDKQIISSFAQQQGCDVALELQNSRFEMLAGMSANIDYSLTNSISLKAQVTDFIQVNPVVNRKVVATAIEWLDIKTSDIVLDLYCGLGNFSLPVAEIAKQVVGLEGVPEMVQRASQNAQQNGISHVDFFCRDLDQPEALKKWLGLGVNKVILDPSRVGAKALMSQIAELKPEKILYVSCNPATFGRDIATLMQLKASNKRYVGYQLRKIALLDMFPYTAHTEVIALLERG
ncbi:23S rRNA (uracil(1939)-C(5))-methyltransferase RlmD [Alteromonas sp. a30]|uniref:23S rRNA (uracil(1939)-C(5))-methyltransferase RlmD n=1 Tax=Alteromonas sp. a30 TaxID=2730917 RepID=UPI002280EA76|nr:23S rRNA (uracil(1939)-C(5))-methyltransferase RlmD [Alteromonas sp. a30]MCY7294293.1 23S rRNA (uracil(1939)-C(5))-methyltransferase RlmD [Alteromonas sp. a30]